MRLPCIVLVLVALPYSSWAADPTPAASATALQMTENPCPPALAMPDAMTHGLDRMLVPGKMDADAQSVFSRPEVQAYLKETQDRARSDWPNLCRYRSLNASQERPVRSVFMGDSITEFWAAADHELFSHGIVGRGISGQTSPQMLLRFFQDVIEQHPKVVHIMAGTNDLAGNTGPTSAQDFKNNIIAMVELAHAHQIKVALASIPPAKAFPWKPGLQPAKDVVALNGWLRRYAHESHSDYVDYYAVLVDEQGGFSAALSNDGVHPNRDGYLKMRALAMQAASP